MANLLLVYDNVAQRRKALQSGLFVDYDFDVTGAGGQATFSMSGFTTLTSSSHVDCLVNGQLKRLGSSYDFTLDTTGNNVVLAETAPQGAWVRVRVYNF